MLTEQINIDALRKSNTEILITAINILTSRLAYFNHKIITVDHIMAATAMPIIFPWQYIDGEPYWDGGLMANVPIVPALEREAKEIIVFLLSPATNYKMSLPQTHRQVLDLMFEQFLIGSYNFILPHSSCKNRDIRLITLSQPSGFFSVLNFSSKQAEELIQEGYENASRVLSF
jgi:NTE family protein